MPNLKRFKKGLYNIKRNIIEKKTTIKDALFVAVIE
jgi:hypothetical protein